MDSRIQYFLVIFLVTFATILSPTNAKKLTPYYYDRICPNALPIIKSVVRQAIRREPRIGASLLRLHFHDCFVNGCDGSVLLDDTPTFVGEKTALPNLNSLRGFEVVDQIKSAVTKACKSNNTVSCADILAIAARDSVTIMGGNQYWYPVLLGRRDALNASKDVANKNLPPPFFNLTQLIANFKSQGLNIRDLVVLSGAHTIGQARCVLFRDRIYNDTNIDINFGANLRNICPQTGSNDNLAPLDSTPNKADTKYFKDLLAKKGLLHSDQELFKGDGSQSDKYVQFYSKYSYAFANDFGVSMIKMGNLKPLTGKKGQIRCDCRKVNPNN